MALPGNLSDVVTPNRSLPQQTANEAITMPRATTDRPALEVNAPIMRPNVTSNAEALAKLLGVAGPVADNIVGDIQSQKDQKNAAQAALDYANGSQNPDLFKKSKAYYNAWQLEGAKSKSLDVAQQAADKVQEVLNNPDATVEDADAAIESVFHGATHDSQGNLLNFGTPEATLTIAHSLAETKAKLMPAVHDIIKKRQDARLLGTAFDNFLTESQRGSPIGGVSDVMGYPVASHVDRSTWDKRGDGSTKGLGFLGPLQRPDGGVSTEISVGVQINGKETEIPLMVPGLTKPELDYLMTHDPSSKDFNKNLPKGLLQKAEAHAKDRIKAGLSPFRQDGESIGGGPKQSILTDPLAPLPGGPEHAPTHILGTLSAPFKGFSPDNVRSGMGAPRAGHRHNGEDFPVPDGTSIVAPMAGTVVASWDDTAHGGGQSVRVKLANGAIVGFAHLSERHAQVGDQVSAGELLGLSGHSGDATGPHVHMTVEVKGKKVSPSQYFASHKGDQVVVATGGEPQLTPVGKPPAPVSPDTPGLDVEAFLSRLPPTISKADGKAYFIKAVIAKAYDSGDARLLNGLENSKRPDGSPSFNPEEQLQIEKTRDEIRDHAVAEAERAQAKAQSDNLDLILNAYNSGNPVSDSWLAAQGAAGNIDPKQAYTLISHNREMRKQAAAEAKAEARAQAADAEAGISADVNSLASEMMAGVPSALGTTEEQLRQRFQNGDFGPIGSRTAMAHFRTLMAARREGLNRLEQSPEFKKYGAMLEQFRPVTAKAGGNPLLLAKPDTGTHLDKPTYAEMTAFYEEQVASGKSAGDAYRAAVDRYVRHASAKGSSVPPNAVNRLSYLKCVQAGICQ